MKSELRKKYRIIRNSLDTDFCKNASEKICKQILSLDEYKNADIIMSYCAIKNEVDVDLVTKDALAKNKITLLPVCDIKNETMRASQLLGMDKRVFGEYGIYVPEKENIYNSYLPELVLLPGLVYNKYGARIGYGKGYYDKFLSKNKNAFKIGISYNCQLSDECFGEDFDIKVDIIVTENGVIRCENSKCQ